MLKSESHQSITHCPGSNTNCVLHEELQALKVEVAELKQLLRTDNLTGLYNQRHLIHSLDLEIERSQRSGDTMAVVMFDLDHFKSVNDTHGHEAGNQVLVATAELVRQQVRKLDIPCRYGGEEFVIVLPNTGMLEAVAVAERIRSAIAELTIKVATGIINPTASFGVDIFDASSAASPEQLIHQADSFLYQAKESGRNRVCHPEILPTHIESEVSDDERDALFDLFGEGDD